MMQSDNISIETAFMGFINHCKVKNLSSSTIKNYNYQWMQFTKWFDSDTVICISQDTIASYIRYLQGKGLRPESINTALRHLRAIFSYFNSQNYCQPVRMTLLKTGQRVKDCYTMDELSIITVKLCSIYIPEYIETEWLKY